MLLSVSKNTSNLHIKLKNACIHPHDNDSDIVDDIEDASGDAEDDIPDTDNNADLDPNEIQNDSRLFFLTNL